MDKKECKRCLLLQSGDSYNYELIQTYIAKIKPADKCDDVLYSQRLEICKSCYQLVNGTCLKCGCYVEFRAAFAAKHCPKSKAIW